MPEGPLRLDLPPCDPGESRWHLDFEEIGGSRVLTGTIFAMTTEALGERVEGFLRAVNVYAARTDAVLQTRVLRTVEPVVPGVDTVGELARLLTGAGIPVGFGRVWTPLPPGARCGVGVRGRGEQIEALLQDYPRGDAG